jgi:secondary thiamine-phosphate synthase enzyme
MEVCPHCGNPVEGAKIKCRICGRMLGAPPAPDEPAGGALMRGDDKRGVAVGTPGSNAAQLMIDTSGTKVVDITDRIKGFARGIGATGLVHVFIPHATAGVALMETGSGSEADLGEVLERLFPSDDRYAHQHGSKGHGRSHVVPVFISPSLSIPAEHGNLALGQWQSIVLVDPNEDNDERRVLLNFYPSGK